MEMRREEVGRVLPPSWARDLEEKQSLEYFSGGFRSRDLNFTDLGRLKLQKWNSKPNPIKELRLYWRSGV